MKKLLLTLTLLALVGCQNISPTASPEASGAEETTVAEQSPTLDPAIVLDPENKQEWNFLLLGGDERAGDPQRENTHTDSITIVNIQEGETVKVTYLGIPRDLWLDEFGIANSVYRVYGPEQTAVIFGDAFGLQIDAVVYVSMDNFADFIDDIDGVTLTVPVAVNDQCGDKKVKFEAGQREIFGGFDLLCLARVRKGYDDGFFTRQLVHAAIIQAMYEKLVEQIVYDPQQLAESALAHPLVKLWPVIETVRIGQLAIRTSLGEVETRTVNLAPPDVVGDTVIGALAGGGNGEIFIHRSAVDLASWAHEAIK